LHDLFPISDPEKIFKIASTFARAVPLYLVGCGRVGWENGNKQNTKRTEKMLQIQKLALPPNRKKLKTKRRTINSHDHRKH
jgi:hypothetical protein